MTFTLTIRTAADRLAEAREGAVLTRFEFARRAMAAGFITPAEAAAWVNGTGLPAAVQSVIDALPEERRGAVTFDVLAMPEIRRTAALMPALAAAFKADEGSLDVLFGVV
jgi:hypothetical protein